MAFVQVVGVLSMIGHEEQNFTNIRIFIPFNTMRELFPLTGNDSKEGKAISFINYQPRTFDENEDAKAELHSIVARNHGGFDPKEPTSGKSGTRSRIRRRWARFSRRWIGFWAAWAW